MSAWSSGIVETNGVEIYYHRTGGEKPPLVLIHGITDNGLCWTPVAQILERDYDIILVDARGHGQSSSPDSGYSAQDHAADMAGLIEALRLEKPALMGHSMGGVIAAAIAANYPQLVSRLVLEDPVWRLKKRSAQTLQTRMEDWQQEVIENQSKTDDELITALRKRSPSWREIEIGPWVKAKKQVNPNALQFVLFENSWQQSIPKIICPALLLTADPDLGAIVNAETAQYVTEINPCIEAVHISDAGHNIRREQYQAYIEEVRKFLGP